MKSNLSHYTTYLRKPILNLTTTRQLKDIASDKVVTTYNIPTTYLKAANSIYYMNLTNEEYAAIHNNIAFNIKTIPDIIRSQVKNYSLDKQKLIALCRKLGYLNTAEELEHQEIRSILDEDMLTNKKIQRAVLSLYKSDNPLAPVDIKFLQEVFNFSDYKISLKHRLNTEPHTLSDPQQFKLELEHYADEYLNDILKGY